jgi:hypothetical protein
MMDLRATCSLWLQTVSHFLAAPQYPGQRRAEGQVSMEQIALSGLEPGGAAPALALEAVGFELQQERCL